jgi:hypothetical protein
MEGFDEVLSDPALGDEVHHGEEQEKFVRCAMVRRVSETMTQAADQLRYTV